MLIDYGLLIGINYIWNEGFNISFDMGYFHLINLSDNLNFNLPMASLKLGYRF